MDRLPCRMHRCILCIAESWFAVLCKHDHPEMNERGAFGEEPLCRLFGEKGFRKGHRMYRNMPQVSAKLEAGLCAFSWCRTPFRTTWPSHSPPHLATLLHLLPHKAHPPVSQTLQSNTADPCNSADRSLRLPRVISHLLARGVVLHVMFAHMA